MLSIRLQRKGRKGQAQYRVVVQDSHLSPTSGKVVAYLGSYDPHAKTTTLTKDRAEFYLKNGAQPSDRAAKLLKSEGVTLPKWVKDTTKKERSIRNPDKLRKNRPAEEAKPSNETPAEEPEAEGTEQPNDEPKTEDVEQPADSKVSENKADSQEAPDKTDEKSDESSKKETSEAKPDPEVEQKSDETKDSAEN